MVGSITLNLRRNPINNKLSSGRILDIGGSGFGSPCSNILFCKWTDGADGQTVPNTLDIGGTWATNHYLTGLQPKYFSYGGTTGAAIREGGTNATTDNRLTGFTKTLASQFSEFFTSYDMAVPNPNTRTFPGNVTPRGLPTASTLKPMWISGPGKIGDANENIDLVVPCYSGTSGWTRFGNKATVPSLTIRGQIWDFDSWTSITEYEKGGTDPYVDNGTSIITMCDDLNGKSTAQRTSLPVMANSTGQWQTVNFPAWAGNGTQDLSQMIFRWFYFAAGANARARLELGNNAAYSLARTRVIPHYSWTDTRVLAQPDYNQLQGMTHWFLTLADGSQISGAL